MRFQFVFALMVAIQSVATQGAQPTTSVGWRRQVTLWRSMLETDKREEAQAAILGITSPQALGAIEWMLVHEPDPAVRVLFLRAVSGIGGDRADQILLRHSAMDSSEAVRTHVRKHLIERLGTNELVRQYAKLLSVPDQAIVNCGAESLAQLNDRAAVEPLIDALVTQGRETRIVGRQFGSQNSGWWSGPGMSYRAWSGGTHYAEIGPRVFRVPMTNDGVRKALYDLTGQDFGYDEKAWRAWWAKEKAAPKQ
jgi:hypothetical protein